MGRQDLASQRRGGHAAGWGLNLRRVFDLRRAGASGGHVLGKRPIKDIVILETLADKQIPEELSEVAIIWFVIEPQGPSVVEVNGKFVGKATA